MQFQTNEHCSNIRQFATNRQNVSVGFAGRVGGFYPVAEMSNPRGWGGKNVPWGVEFDPAPSCTVSAVHDAATE